MERLAEPLGMERLALTEHMHLLRQTQSVGGVETCGNSWLLLLLVGCFCCEV